MPDAPTPKSNLNTLLRDADAARERGNASEAIASYTGALAIDPRNTYARYWLATCYEELGELELARQQCDSGLSVEPKQIGLLLRKASIAVAASDHLLALSCYLLAAECDPDIPAIDALIADRYCFLGEPDRGAEYFDRALTRNPESTQLQSNRLFVRNYGNITTPEQLFAMHRQWGAQHESRLRSEWRPHTNSRRPDRLLRIGYVSGDLRHHAVAFFVEPLLRHHDSDWFSVYCYDTSTHAEDDVAVRLRSYGHCWRRAASLSDTELAQAIRADEIDILIDLSGHTVFNRLLTFARKPAPIQATWLGYLGTTGLAAIDYRITDAYLDPPGMTEQYHTEKLYRLPNAACFVPVDDAPESGDLPALANRAFTFGSVNQWSKVNGAVRETWAEILQAVPDSRLIIIAPSARNPDFAANVANGFSRHGIDTRRVILNPTTSLHNFLELFRQVDIALDPFPYGGGTTTMHSLWMGVPVVTLAGSSAFARNSVGPLTETGLRSFIADSRGDYVRVAAEMASNRADLREVRRTLRQRMLSSTLLDQEGFTRRMEGAFREMWSRYCAAN